MADTGAVSDISDLAGFGPGTADSLGDALVISWRDVATVADTVDVGDVPLSDDVGTVNPDGSIAPDVLDSVGSPPDGMKYIPSGKLWMGCNEAVDKQCGLDEKPQHEVRLSAYFIDETEVTVSAYQACVSTGVCSAPKNVYSGFSACNHGLSDKDDHPAACVTWCQARAYCAWAEKRLPTEAEWEMAARGSCEYNLGDLCKDSMRIYPWGNDKATCEFVVMDEGGVGCGKGGVWGVGSKPKGDSVYGVKDLSGNVWEWVEDCWGTYAKDSVVNPLGASCAAPNEDCQGGGLRVVRGGGFYFYDAYGLRATVRMNGPAASAGYDLGFRCARSIP